MKQSLPFITLATMVAASCNTNSDASAKAQLQAYKDSVRLAADTAGLTQFRQWKSQHELTNINEYGSNNVSAAPAKKTTVVYTPVHKTTRSSSANNSNRSVNYSSGTMSSESGNAAKAPEKKGWSKAAKGAAIGGGTGAVIGAVVNKKNRAVGAVIGGVVGAGAGYGIGRHMDKKDGRY